jgi:hypothetical protein
MTDKKNDIAELERQADAEQEILESRHKEEVKELEKKIKTLSSNLDMVKLKNKTDELKLRDDYKKADRLYGENINTYDLEMRDRMRQKEAMQ